MHVIENYLKFKHFFHKIITSKLFVEAFEIKRIKKKLILLANKGPFKYVPAFIVDI